MANGDLATRMILGAHQPNFLPWEPFFEKIRACDRFVVLTHVQFVRRQYQSRFEFKGAWHTMSVDAGRGLIVDKRYVAPMEDWARIKRRLPGHRDALAFFDDLVNSNLVNTNVGIIRRICTRLGIKTEIVLDHPTELRATARLVELCKRYGATTYLSGPSGPTYMDMSVFEAAGIGVEVQNSTGKRPAVELLATLGGLL